MASFKTFEEIEAYRLARELRKELSIFCRRFPAEERYRLADQIVRASRSVTANIAEGFGRHHHQENVQFCRQGRGSLMELMDHLGCALDEGYATREEYEHLCGLTGKALKVLNGYIAYLRKCANSGVPTPTTQQPDNPTTSHAN